MDVRITKFGVHPESLQTAIERKFVSVGRAYLAMGSEARDYMHGIIRTSLKRPDESTGNLIDSIKMDVTPTFVGVGNTVRMDVQAPYWRLIDLGGTVARANYKRHYVPGFFAGNRYIYDPGTTGYLLPSGLKDGVVITGMHFVSKTFLYAKTFIRVRLDNLLRGKVTVMRRITVVR